MAGYYDEIPLDQGPGGSPQIGIDLGGSSGDSNSGWNWGGFGKLGMDLLGGVLPGALGAAAGYGFNALMPGQTKLIDQRNPQQRGAAQMGLSGMQALQKNPNSFGLPGDPEDVNTPAGRKLYGIRQQARGADAARGMFTTGGSAQRENNAVTDASNSAFQNLMQTYGQQAQAGPGMALKQYENPWAKLLSGVAGPAIGNATSAALRNFGIQSENPFKFGV